MNTIEITVPYGSNLKNTIETNLNDIPKEGGITWTILNKEGDRKIIWHPNSFTDIREAKEVFDQLIAKGMVPYYCDDKGQPTGEIMTEFDPSTGIVSFNDVIWTPKKLAVGG